MPGRNPEFDRKAIPTVYNGIQFRSRLEAKWAAFFDLLGWRWEYEPFDMDGWIPDFLINEHDKVLVEVKPVLEYPSELAGELLSKKGVGLSYGTFNGSEYELLIVGCTIEFRCGCGQLSIGWLDGDVAVFGMWEKSNGRIGFTHTVQSFHDRITGNYDGGCYGRVRFVSDVNRTVLAAWREAGNIVQWKSPRNP